MPAPKHRTAGRALVSFAALLLALILCTASADAQSTTKAPAARAVAVVELTGTLDKPKQSRVIPVAFWDGQQFQDAGVYLARPAPLALEPGVEYEVEQSGEPKVYYDLREVSAIPQSSGNAAWFGYGSWRAYKLPPAPKARQAKVEILGNSDDGRPHLKRRAGSEENEPTPAPAAPAEKSDRPVLKQHQGSESDRDAAVSPEVVAQDHREHPDTDASTGGKDDSKKGKKKKNKPPKDVAAAYDVGNDDPDRPHLRRNPQGDADAFEASRLTGSPADLVQYVAVSDAKQESHRSFRFEWPDEETREAIRVQLEAAARKALGANATAPPAGGGAGNGKPQQTIELRYSEDDFRAFDLEQTHRPTFVYTAHTEDGAGREHQLTLIAQAGEQDRVYVLAQNVYDSAYPAESPSMKLLDAVDAAGDDRAALLFELRGNGVRNFALWKVRRGSAEELLRSGDLP